ncbi:5-oxopent-3-ene-1,2,5-tricarboxylate decarboxylase [Limnohabitans sp. TS-CS-82]|uniref:fumarylacetoacetate hydrolase family protein n=1 Tax=Limnohabitans sp. TS-CS-82 TaxID=2094193 RepID=UPI000CF1DB36|nr:fumarylacetoacetate hydrolase family protein [Limnohabitans sp. TS-CS-82]PQA79963.1 5-oxopent-3-ene-1,2,5-tricarboxylate decarboxylase [Limnohabitans sp. TS-CS-82]
MRFLSFKTDHHTGVGWIKDASSETLVDLSLLGLDLPADLKTLIATEGAMAAAHAAALKAPATAIRTLSSVQLLPLIPNPGKIVCMGLNYADHAKEGGNARPEYPSFFMRGATSMVGHQSPIVRPKASTQLDYEAELAVVIGQRARHLTADNALACIAGYACFNDASIRNYQRKSAQWTIGKNFDGTGPFGPWLVTPDELPAGAEGLRIQSRLNGKVMQDANTRDFLWNVVESLRIITECMTLEPGDVVITGTPAGVGYARTPPVWMAPGDVCEIEIEGIGTLSNPIVDEQ